jgi:hypothetical protein
MTRNIVAATRPFILTFHSGGSHRLTSEEAQRLLDDQPTFRVSRDCVVFHGHTLPRTASSRVTLRPATLGGGPAFSW